ncbi:hypothetical protein RFI_10001 [Reticulomyxa filosa]|uniref:Uncharacterized protein n=1 Tax=Reticulomyxa filosa TaxID=46433 RepID=X6NMG9_RETFI|nr:hypothetical protein RFI_10001 [Reticulomyxa filosa]|eukprot:ETO27133.1 hypothetical protein RFI_10001 [Reticulomyxa filosa]
MMATTTINPMKVTGNWYWIKAGGLIELGFFMFFSIIFAYPLHKFLKHSKYGFAAAPTYTSVMSTTNHNDNTSNQQRQTTLLSCETTISLRKEFKKVLRYNLTLSVAASLTSFLTLWFWPSPRKHDQRWFIALIDYCVAVLTTFAMSGRNRKFLHYYFSSCRCHQLTDYCYCSMCFRNTNDNDPLRNRQLMVRADSCDLQPNFHHIKNVAARTFCCILNKQICICVLKKKHKSELHLFLQTTFCSVNVRFKSNRTKSSFETKKKGNAIIFQIENINKPSIHSQKMSYTRICVTIDSKEYQLEFISLTIETLRQQVIEASNSGQQGSELIKITDDNACDIETSQQLQQAVADGRLRFIACFQPKKIVSKSDIDQLFERGDIQPVSINYCDNYYLPPNLQYQPMDDKKNDIQMETNGNVETLDFKKHWNRGWRKANVEAVKMVNTMLNKKEQGLIVVAKNLFEWQKIANPDLIKTYHNSFLFRLLVNNDKVNKKQFREYCVYTMKDKLLHLDGLDVDGNVYAINCEIQSQENINVTTQFYVTKDTIIDQKLKKLISPIQWNTKIHYEIPLKIQEIEDKEENCSGKQLFDDAIVHLQNYLQLSIEMFGVNNHYVAIAYNLLAIAYYHKGQNSKAIEYNEKALKLLLHIFGMKCVFVAQLYENLGVTYKNNGRHDKAIECYMNSLNIGLELFGENNTDVAASYNSLGHVYHNKGHFDDAIQLYEKALKIRLDIFGNNHDDVANSYNNIGNAFYRKEQNEKAIEYYEKALTIRKTIFGNSRQSVGDSYWNLGLAFKQKGEKKVACKYYNEAWKLYSVSLGEWHVTTLGAKEKVKELYEDL